jgi:Spy/CpxP family protein refolding chaperone
MRSLRMLGAIALVVAAPLAAQQPAKPDTMRVPMREPGMMGPGMMGHGHGMMEPGMGGGGPMMEMMGPMMRSMAFAPAHLLARKDVLGLTAQQVTRLTALQDASKTAHDAAAAEVHTHMEALQQAMQAAAPDTVQVKLHFQAVQAAMGRAHWAMLSAQAQARGVLTEGQRGRVDGWADSHQMPMRHGGPMGMMRRWMHRGVRMRGRIGRMRGQWQWRRPAFER